MAARYYVYWNLHKDCFSVQHKGKVIKHATEFYGTACEFKVRESGRQKVLKEQRKNVHAFVVCCNIFDEPSVSDYEIDTARYNPYKGSSFVNSQDKPITHTDCVKFSIVDKKPKIKILMR